LARISKEFAEGPAEKADRVISRRGSAGSHGCGGEHVRGNRGWWYGIKTDRGGVDTELKYFCEIEWSGIGRIVLLRRSRWRVEGRDGRKG
jgi:hypothetical protein